MGRAGTRFGRNAPTEATEPEPMPQRMEPNPREVANRLLLRDEFKPATSLNVLAACWIQFQNHDWFGHGENDPDNFIEVELPPNDDWPDGEVMKVKATIPDRTRTGKSGLPPTFINTVTHWWDLSQIYGSTEERNRELRSGEDGKLKIEDGMLPEETERKLKGVDLTGFSDNYWVGLALLHTLFAKEHNAICDHLKGSYPTWDDEKLFLTARLVNSALSAKIHTVEWTPGILANPVLERAMHANWYGVLPQWVRRKFGHVGTEMIGGIVGSDQEHHTAPYAITEEFISVYRLHPLLPDDYEIRSHKTGEVVGETDFDPIQGAGTRPTIEEYGWSDLLYSFGIANPGAITLRNHPKALSNHVRLTGDRVDLGTIDILRDRERGVPRYNDFREKLRKKRVTKFEDLSDDPKLVEEIRDVYDDDIDRVDLQVGMLAEPLPPGLRVLRHRVPDLHPDGVAAPALGPVLHQRLLARRLHARGPALGRGVEHERRAAPPPPGARAGARGRRERVRALEADPLSCREAASRRREPRRERPLQRDGRRPERAPGHLPAPAPGGARRDRGQRRRPRGRPARGA